MNNIYIPTEFINSDYYYSYNNNILTVYKECENNSCNCNDIYIDFDYNVSENYVCNVSHETLLNGTFTDNIYYRQDFTNILIILVILSFFIIFIPFKILFRLFRRFDF